MDLKDMIYNHFEPPEGMDPLDYIPSCIETLTEANYFGELARRILEDALLRSYKEMPTINGENIWPNFPQVFAVTREKIAELRENNISGTTFNDVLFRIETRLPDFIDKPDGDFNCHKGIPLSFFFDKNIIITGLDKTSKNKIRTFILGIYNKMFLYCMENNLRDNYPRTLFVVDEGYRWFDADIKKDQYRTDERMRTLFRESREFGLGWLIGGQQSTAVTSTFKSLAGTTITYKSFSNDLNEIKALMGMTEEQKQYMHKITQKFTGAVKTINSERPVLFALNNIKFPAKDVTKEEILKINERLLKPITEPIQAFNAMARVKMDIFLKARNAKQQDVKKGDKEHKLSEDSSRVIKQLLNNPFLHFSAIGNALNFHPLRTKETLAYMYRNSMLSKTVKCTTASNGAEAKFYPLADNFNPRVSARLFKHHYYCHRVNEYVKSKGIEGVREYPRIKGAKGIDVAAIEKKDHKTVILTAYEITLSFDNLRENIEKCIQYGAQEIIIVCERKDDLTAAQNQLKKESFSIPENVKMMTIHNFL